MYCLKCGKEIDEGSSFCAHCGMKIGTSNTEMSVGKEKENDLVLLRMARKYIEKIQPYYEANIGLEERKAELRSNIQRFYFYRIRAIAGWFFSMVFLVLLISSISSSTNSTRSSDFWVRSTSGFSSIGIILSAAGLVVFVVMGIINTYRTKLIKNSKPQYEEEIKQCDASIETNNESVRQIAQSKEDAVNGTLFFKIFPNGATVEIVDTIIEYITTNRADSIKEALQLYDQKKFREKMLYLQAVQTSYAADIAAYTKMAADSAQKAAENSAAAAHAANDAAVYGRLNLHK